MRTYGNANTSVGARDGIPVPTTPSPWPRREELVECHCKYKGRPGAFHVCLKPVAPEPAVPPVALKPKKPVEPPKPKKRPGPKPSLNEEQSAEAARMYVEQGLPLLAVANHFDVSPNAVTNALKRLNVPRRTSGKHSPRRGAA